ncbi:ABC transporter substrate-binding protein [Dongshaea marina]|uniref:ABC transporter substrate-binding protein n=1 Tax=Dongshaea marina TaxID=2047966 RepID=UPI000D3E08D6|nr:ABC transporter substrate binding protein [Dongshaea marina]
MNKVLLIGIVLFGVFLGPVSFAKSTVLVIESYHGTLAWDQEYKQGLEAILGQENQLSYFELDSKRLPEADYQRRAELAWQRYQELKPELVILGDDNALRLLGKRFLATNTPVVFLGINNNPRDYVPLGRNITGVLERPLIKRSMVSLFRIDPGAKRFLILFDNSVTSRISVKSYFGDESELSDRGVSITLKLIGNWEQWQETVLSAASHYDLIVIGIYTSVSDEGLHIPSDKVLRWTSAHTPVPLFGFWDISVGPDKAMGGLVLSGYEQGREAGIIAREILRGATAASIRPRVAQKGYYLFSKTQMKKWGVELPVGIAQVSSFVE